MSVLPPTLVDALSNVRSVGVITGAGVSAESGIATYRGKGGVYDDPEEGDRTIEALTASTLKSDPDRTWRAIAKVARESAGAEPNAGHLAIASIERRVERFVLLTQNVDGLHQTAGSRNIIDIHGTVAETTCMTCGREAAFDAREELAKLDAAPRCTCGGIRRPNAVLFGEVLSEKKVRQMHDELVADPPDLVLLAGTSALFPYIAQPVFSAKTAGKLTVEVNPETTHLSDVVDYWLEGKAGALIPEIAACLGG